VGPNAVLALAREGYSWKVIHMGDVMDYLTYGGFWAMTFRYWQMGFVEMIQSLVKVFYVRSARKLMPSLKGKDLVAGGSGVRAQAVDKSGKLVNDFLYVQQEDATHVLNAPSPAATSSLALAKRIVDLVTVKS